jgi:MerR family transcriptional regulator/heat shock protein HspR
VVRQQRGSSGKDRPVYMISVAAELAGVHPQTLRIYERKALVQPTRSPGGTRLYSDADIERLRLIQRLTQDEGVNLAGVMRIIELEIEKERLEAQLAEAEAAATRAERKLASEINEFRKSMRADIVHVPRGGIVRREGR